MADSFSLLADLIADKDSAALALSPHQALHACRCVGTIRADQWLRSMGIDTSMRLVISTNRACRIRDLSVSDRALLVGWLRTQARLKGPRESA